MSEKKPLPWAFSAFEKSLRRDRFDCGNPELNRYLSQQAGQDIKRNVSKIRVALSSAEPERIIAFSAISSGAAVFTNFPDPMRKKLPQYPVPIARIGRLAVDREFQGQGLGQEVLMDAFGQILNAGKLIGVAAIVVDAKDENAVRFYKKYGFECFVDRDRELFIMTKTVQQLFT